MDEQHKSAEKFKNEARFGETPYRKGGKELRAMMPWIGKNKLVDKDKNELCILVKNKVKLDNYLQILAWIVI